MRNESRKSLNMLLGLAVLLCILYPTTGSASGLWKYGDLVITDRNGKPCFSYPVDKGPDSEKYSFYEFEIIKKPQPLILWKIKVGDAYKVPEEVPNSPRSCILYGERYTGTRVTDPAEKLLLNTPYEASLTLSASALRDRIYVGHFCLTRDKKGKTKIIKADWNRQTLQLECINPKGKR